MADQGRTDKRRKRLGRRWHRWGRFRWYVGNELGLLSSYGWSFRRREIGGRMAVLCAGPLYATYWCRNRHG